MEPRVKVNAAGGFEARPMVYVTLTIDHRALDGFQANAFLTKWVEAIEQWMTAPGISGGRGHSYSALVIDIDAVEENIAATLRLLGNEPDRWRPHLKTAKLALVMRTIRERGVSQAKCSTTLELETACEEDFRDVLLAYPVTGPQVQVVKRIAADQPGSMISVWSKTRRWWRPGAARGSGCSSISTRAWTAPGCCSDGHDEVIGLARGIAGSGLRFAGLHYYDGHAADFSPGEAADRVHAGYDRLLTLIERLTAAGIRTRRSSPREHRRSRMRKYRRRFSELGVIHRVSPGTVVYNDRRSMQQLPSNAGYQAGSLRGERSEIIPDRPGSVPMPGTRPSRRTQVIRPAVMGHHDYVPRHPSEEHLPVDVPAGAPLPPRGTRLWLWPSHVCPTVSNFDHAVIISGWEVPGGRAGDRSGRHPPLEVVTN